MKKIVLVATLLACALGQASFAQTANFTGFTVAGNLNTTSSNLEASGSGTTATYGATSNNVSIEAAYGIAAGQSLVFNLGATFLLGDQKLATATSGSTTAEISAKNVYSLFVEPTYVLSANTAMYAKLGYLSADGKSNISNGTQGFNGVAYGAGFRHFFDKNLFAQVEFTQSNYESKSSGGTSVKPSLTAGTVGIGYKF
jgi:Outer membrane protein beta-barrel domain